MYLLLISLVNNEHLCPLILRSFNDNFCQSSTELEKTKETKRQVSIFNKQTIKAQRDAMKGTPCVFYSGIPPIPLIFYNSKCVNVLYSSKDKCAQSLKNKCTSLKPALFL